MPSSIETIASSSTISLLIHKLLPKAIVLFVNGYLKPFKVTPRIAGVRGMKERGYWNKKDRTVRSHGWIYNIDKFVCDKNNKLEAIVADECMCQACVERRLEYF